MTAGGPASRGNARTQAPMPKDLNTHQKLLSIIGLIVFAAILLLAFRAYLSPAMLFDFASLQLCS